jgi:hypothetical protein
MVSTQPREDNLILWNININPTTVHVTYYISVAWITRLLSYTIWTKSLVITALQSLTYTESHLHINACRKTGSWEIANHFLFERVQNHLDTPYKWLWYFYSFPDVAKQLSHLLTSHIWSKLHEAESFSRRWQSFSWSRNTQVHLFLINQHTFITKIIIFYLRNASRWKSENDQ